MSGSGITASYAYNGLGDRLQQTVNSIATNYTLDLARGLTQVLSDGTHDYLYGNGRIGDEFYNSWQYHLSDGLGSVRQLIDQSGVLTLAKGYEPYGEVLDSAGSGTSSYGYTGEWTDNTGMVYLRARYYDPTIARFMTKDTWPGNTNQPMSYNAWLYVNSNPINRVDPFGKFSINISTEVPAWIAVSAAKIVYSKVGPVKFCLFHPDDGQWPSDTVNDLLTDFICEYGDYPRTFNADTHLTQELARSFTMSQLRLKFYLGLIDSQKHTYNFGNTEFFIATIDSWKENDEVYFDIIPANLSLPINITHFLGSFAYQITWAGDRIKFEVDNTTELASGTRIPPILGGVDISNPYQTSIEEIISMNPSLSTETVGNLMEQYPVISILMPKTRLQTSLLEGGGAMDQIFLWYEKYDPCMINIFLFPFYIMN